jgi:uncharacterized membrane protein
MHGPLNVNLPISNTWAIFFPNILRMNTDTVSLQQFRTPCVYIGRLIARLGTAARVALSVVIKNNLDILT